MTSLAQPLVVTPPPPPLLATARTAALVAFFPALAVSVSATQILLAVLLVLAFPWGHAGPAPAGTSRLGAFARQSWAQVEPLGRHPLSRPLLVFVALTLLSAALSGDPASSLWRARDIFRILVLYLVLWYTRDSAHALRLWSGFLGLLTLMACYGIAQAALCGAGQPALSAALRSVVCTHPERVSGPFSIYMTFGGVLLIGSLFFIAHLANLPWRRTWWMAPAAVVTVIALALTQSRNAWLGLVAGTVMLLVTARRAVRLVVILAGALVVAALLTPAPVRDRARSVMDLEDATLRDRVAMWRSGLAMVADHPFLGVGPDQVRVWYPQYRRPEAVRPSTGHLHNSPVHLAAERGLPALAAWLWLWVVFFREGFRVLRRAGPGHPWSRGLVCASLGGVVGFLAAGLFEHNFGDAEVVMLVYGLMALPSIAARDLAPGAVAPRGAPAAA